MNPYAHDTSRRCLPATNAGSGAFEIFKNALRRMVKLTARFSQCDGSCVAVEQFRAEFRFQG